MDYKNVILEKKGSIAVLTINRPKALNALNRDTLVEIGAAAAEFRDDPALNVMVITGSGDKSFVAGADISFMQNMTAIEGREFGRLGNRVTTLLEDIEKPIIAAINGFCLGGGCELAMSCDFRLCSDNAKFGQPEVGLGVTPGFGGTQRLPRIVGTGMAMQLLVTGDMIGADEALRIGLVNKVYPQASLMDEAMKIAGKISSCGQIAVRFCKKLVIDGMQVDINRAMTLEEDLFGLCFSTQDQKEGMTAFVEKRKAVFKGK
jgi:enoyl-CoA hydratase